MEVSLLGALRTTLTWQSPHPPGTVYQSLQPPPLPAALLAVLVGLVLDKEMPSAVRHYLLGASFAHMTRPSLARHSDLGISCC